MMGKKKRKRKKREKRLYDIELLDTGTRPSRVIKRGKAFGYYPKQALRNFAKTLPKWVDLNEWRTPKKKYSRYVFLHGLAKKKK